jgi:hypothetical protein
MSAGSSYRPFRSWSIFRPGLLYKTIRNRRENVSSKFRVANARHLSVRRSLCVNGDFAGPPETSMS